MSIPRPEHPFPQMERENWKNLNGEWQFEFDFGKSGQDRNLQKQDTLKEKIIVPFCPESSLSGIAYTDFIPAVWYKRSIEVSDAERKGRILLHFGAVDYECHIYVNGISVGSHKGGYSSFQFDITSTVVTGTNILTVYAEDDSRSGLQPRGKQCPHYDSSGCDYTRTTGIWQTVWLEFVPQAYIKAVEYYPNMADGTITIKALVEGNGQFTALASLHGKDCGTGTGIASYGIAHVIIKLQELALWEVGNGNLYDLKLTFGKDQVSSYFGMRELKMEGMKFLLNGRSIFQRLVLDQGFYRDSIYTAPTDDALIKDIQLSLAMGFNGARLHQKVFEPRFLYHCDRMGYMVWGEHANWGLDLSNDAGLKAFLPEWLEIVSRDFNHPSIVGWCPFNETWDHDGRKQLDDTLSIIYHATKQLDPTRPCIDTSGNFHVVTDIYDLHDYTQNVEQFKNHYEDFKTGGAFRDAHSSRQHYTDGLPVFISEYGGIKWAPIADEKAWGYGEAPTSEEEFLARYNGLTTVLLDHPKIFGFCYTQLYDIEQEMNGLYDYDRKPKFKPELIHAINTKKAVIED